MTGNALMQVANEIGFPLMIKATAGGGGKGMRLVEEEKDFLRLLRAAQGEAEAAFGNADCYIERYVKNPRHIEFQVWSLAFDASVFCWFYDVLVVMFRLLVERNVQDPWQVDGQVRAFAWMFWLHDYNHKRQRRLLH